MKSRSPALKILAGPKALQHIRERGLSPADIACIPAAAGGPKGLLLRELDKYLFGSWLPSQPRTRQLIGASIGAWRMACGAAHDPAQAFDDLTRIYMQEQRYTASPTRMEISRVMRKLLSDVMATRREAMLNHPQHRLHVLVNRGIGALDAQTAHHRRGFFRAGLANLRGRPHLARHMERMVFHEGETSASIFNERFDAFATHLVPLTYSNFDDVLIASGSIPMVMDPVRDLRGAPLGCYWDGGIIDYHLHLPYQKMDGLTLYPHFADAITPGWLDKFIPWRKAQGTWLDTLVMLCPTREFVSTLPSGRIPDRKDFNRYGNKWQAREAAWNKSLGQAGRLAEEFAEAAAKNNWAQLAEPLV